jgi:ATP adenylyltransferase
MTISSESIIARGELQQRLEQTVDSALAEGALHRIESRSQIITDGGIPFVVRIAVNLQRKAEEKAHRVSEQTPCDPFAPPEPPLTVGTIGDGHIAVLNKYNVVENHLLLVTRHYESQEALLTPADFEALCWCLREIDGLGFYNGGTVAGASQHHKHLQLIPRSFSPGEEGLPVERLLPEALPLQPSRLEALPFAHHIAPLPPQLFDTPATAAVHCHRLYHQMLHALQITPLMQGQVECHSAPYNLLLTRRWMMLVPRTREHFEEISINAMGFAGSLFVRNEKELLRVKEVGPLHILGSVSGAV